MEHTKASLKKALIDGKLSEAVKATFEYAEYCGLVDVTNGLIVLNSQLEEHQHKWNIGTVKYEDYSTHHARISHSLTQWITSLPDNPKPNKRKKKLLKEATFKARVFYGLIIIKVLVVLRLFYHWRTGGFDVAEFQATATLLIPAFAGLISIMLGDFILQHQKDTQHPKYISGPLVMFSYWILPIYAIALITIIELKPSSPMDFAQMSFWLALVESVLGGYIGQIVYAFFKKE